ncbi:MAG: DNA methyltransferase [bacterium]|nr:DNA methyltransferase [bacterium]MDE0602010.1 DNA methyltransferase [bacterium]
MAPKVGANWVNKTVWTGDNIDVMRGMNSETVDLLYLDPPFNSKADYAAPIGSAAAGAAFKDTWTLTDLDIEWIDLIEDKHPALWRVLLAAMTPSDKSYLVYMAIRLLEMRRLLKPTGSIYLHCDPTMSHYLKLLMDAIYGRGNFRNEIIWAYHAGGASRRYFPRKHDVLLLYGKDAKKSFHQPLRGIPYRDIYAYDKAGKIQTDKGYHPDGKMVPDWWEISLISSVSKERTGYPTQKPLALLNQVIKASSKPGDVVLDPFCGCATTMVAADDHARQWIGIDISPKAAELVVHRVQERQGLFRDITHRTDVPQRTDLGPLPAAGSLENRHHLYGVQGGHCAGCGEHFKIHHLEVDHIIARTKGGTDHLDNLQLLCGHCNRVKGNRGMEYLRAKLRLAA